MTRKLLGATVLGLGLMTPLAVTPPAQADTVIVYSYYRY
jgi:hypothetical protein